MAAYNEDEWVEEAIDSILDQTFDDFEFIIVDDGSTDNTSDILASYEDEDDRIKVISQENTGLTKALNNGLDHCTGKYVARMDANDIALPKRLEKQVRFLDDHPDHAVVGTWREEFWEEQDKQRTLQYPTANEDIQRTLVRYCCLGHSTTMMRASVLKELRYNEAYDHSQDYELWTRLGADWKLANIPEVLMRIRRIPGSVTTGKSKWKDLKYQSNITMKAYQNLETRWHDFIHVSRPLIVFLLPQTLINHYVDWITSK